MAEASFMLAIEPYSLKIYGIGAREAKNEFGAMRKDAIARLLAAEYPNRLQIVECQKQDFPDHLRYGSDRDGWIAMKDLSKDSYVANHVSDAIAIASVVNRRLTREKYELEN